jgi:hypothetical protein
LGFRRFGCKNGRRIHLIITFFVFTFKMNVNHGLVVSTSRQINIVRIGRKSTLNMHAFAGIMRKRMHRTRFGFTLNTALKIYFADIMLFQRWNSHTYDTTKLYL